MPIFTMDTGHQQPLLADSSSATAALRSDHSLASHAIAAPCPEDQNAVLQIEPLEHALGATRLAVTPNGPATVLTTDDDKYLCMIRHILRRESRLSSLCSSCSSSNTGDTAAPSDTTFSSIASTAVAADDEKFDHATPSPTSICISNTVLAEYCSAEIPEEGQNRRKSSHRSSLSYKVYDYSHRVHRYVPLTKVVVVALLLLLSVAFFYLIGFDISQSQTMINMALLFFGLTTCFLCFSTFKRWFYYWDPDISFTRPS